LVVLEEMLKAYVERNSGVCCAQWDPAISERLLFDPYDMANRAWAAHYFLLNAAISRRCCTNTRPWYSEHKPLSQITIV